MRELQLKEIEEVNGASVTLAALVVGVAVRFTANQLIRHYASSAAVAAGAYGVATEYGG